MQGINVKELSAEADLAIKLDIIRRLQGSHQASIDAATARNILHEELGYFTDEQTVYHLDEPTRDRLIAHTRQDAAHSVLAAATNAKALAELKRLLRIIIVLLLIITALMVFSLFR